MLINTTLLPKWVYRGMFVFNDRLLAAIDGKLRDFVTVAKNIELTHNDTATSIKRCFSETAFCRYMGSNRDARSVRSVTIIA